MLCDIRKNENFDKNRLNRKSCMYVKGIINSKRRSKTRILKHMILFLYDMTAQHNWAVSVLIWIVRL